MKPDPRTTTDIIALFARLNRALDEGKLNNLKVARTAGGDCHVGFDWITQWETLQPFELHVEFVLDTCHLCLGFNPDDAYIQPFVTTTNKLEEWRRLVGLMDDRLASVELFLSQVRDELLNPEP